MKRSIIIALFLFLAVTSFAQFSITKEAAQRLGNDSSFSKYASVMMRYVKEKQLAFKGDSAKERYYSKQEKYLARNLMYLEGRQDSEGNITNYVDKTYKEAARYDAMARVENIESANGTWLPVGPTNSIAGKSSARGIGRVDRIAFHPTNANIVFAGTPSGGLWKTTNGGTSWSSISAFMPNLSVSGLVVSWANADEIYVLTGDGDSNLGSTGFVQSFDYIRPSIGILKSTDGGLNWSTTGSLNIPGFYVGYKLIQSPTNAQILIAATSRGLFRTSNGGASWQLVSPTSDKYYDVEWKPGNATKVYAASSKNFYISSNAGSSFQNEDDNFDVLMGEPARTAIAVTPANPNVVYVFSSGPAYGNSAQTGIFKSTNSGASFVAGCKIYFSSSPEYMHNIAVSNTSDALVFLGTKDFYRDSHSFEDCGTYKMPSQTDDASLSNYVHADIHEVAVNPLNGDLYLGSDGGVHKSTDNGATFTACYNMSNTQFFHFGISETAEQTIVGGAQDNGISIKEAGSSTFSHFAGGDGFEIEFLHNNTNQAYFSVNKSLYKTNVGLTGFDQQINLEAEWYHTVAVSHANSNIVYASASDVYKTTNGGTTWNNIGGRGRWALATCASNANRVYAAGGATWSDGGSQIDKKMQRSDDAGATWIDLQEKPGFAENITKITGIAVHEAISSRVWVSMGGFTAGEKVYASTNAGETWTNMSGSLPNLPVNCVVMDANFDTYIGTDIGVFFRSSTMTDWQPFYNFMPQVPVTELIIRGSTIFASTFGRGIWKSDTHTACEGTLNLNSSIHGYRFYEAININSAANIYGGEITDIYYKAQDAVTLTENFRIDASTGENFRAWIANCNSGGIPSAAANSTAVTIENDDITFEMPFDGKASIVIVNEKGEIKKIIADNQSYQQGKVTIHKTNLQKLKGNLMLIVDGAVVGTKTL